MKKLLAIVFAPPIPQLLGLLILSAVVWFGGRALESWHGLSDRVLLYIVAGIWALAALVFVWRRWQSARRARLIEDRLRGQAREHRESVRPDKRGQVEELEKQLSRALTTLKSSKLGKGALYQLPWYVIIGPPGSGKTTLLRESNLTFPDQQHGRGVRGVGGTRNCDWWFTDQGILLDTAGRYTTQDEDRNEWFAFLEMLKKARSKKPINGAIIAISVAELVQASEVELAEHARRVRERLAELTERLEVVFPVYLLFSKCDLLEGFVETFSGYGQQQRAQIWGCTLPYHQDGSGSLVEAFDREYDALQQRLSTERLQVLGNVKSQAKKARVFSFPMQFARARSNLRTFLSQVEQPNPYHESSDLRGFYFTSGTQEGKPLDQVLAGIRSACGLTVAEDEAAEEKVDKKAYFIDDLFGEVVFPDKELARSSARAQKRRELWRKLGIVATAAATLLLSVLVVYGYTRHASAIDRASQAYAAASAFDPADEQDLRDEERLLDKQGGPFEQLRRVFVELDEQYRSVGSYVMGQTNELYDRRIRPLYVEKLERALIAPLQDRLRQDLERAIENRDQEQDIALVSDKLTAYRMLGGEPPLDRAWLRDDFLKRADTWTWRLGAEIPACRAHRETFLERVFDATWSDWPVMPRESLIPDADKMVRGKDVLMVQLNRVLEMQGQADSRSFTEIFAEKANKDLLDPQAATITQAFVNEAPLDDVLEETGQRIGDNGGADLKRRSRQAAIGEWTANLARMRPIRKSILPDAMDAVARLTGEDSIYIDAYREVCGRLTRLGVEAEAGDVAWLVETLTAIRELQQVVEPLCASTRHLERIVPAARERQNGAIDPLRKAFSKVRNLIRTRTNEYADPQLAESMQSALTGLVETLEYALAREIVEETSKVWGDTLGRELRRFSARYPFDPEAAEGVDPARFDAVFGRGGELATALRWIEYLEQTLDQIGFGDVTDEFDADRRILRRLQEALFRGGEAASCEIEFRLQKRGNMAATRFVLGPDELEARRPADGTFGWRPALGSTIEIVDYQFLDQTLTAKVDRPGNWGFLRLLAAGRRGVVDVRGVQYQSCLWDDFPHPRTKVRIATADTAPEAMLLFRTEAEPNPLQPGFFVHRFAEEVFRAEER